MTTRNRLASAPVVLNRKQEDRDMVKLAKLDDHNFRHFAKACFEHVINRLKDVSDNAMVAFGSPKGEALEPKDQQLLAEELTTKLGKLIQEWDRIYAAKEKAYTICREVDETRALRNIVYAKMELADQTKRPWRVPIRALHIAMELGPYDAPPFYPIFAGRPSDPLWGHYEEKWQRALLDTYPTT